MGWLAGLLRRVVVGSVGSVGSGGGWENGCGGRCDVGVGAGDGCDWW